MEIEIESQFRKLILTSNVFYNFCNCNFESMRAKKIEQPFMPYCYSSVDKCWELWFKWLYQIIDANTPRRTRQRQSYPPWMSSETSQCSNKPNSLKSKSEQKSFSAPSWYYFDLECVEMQSNDRENYKKHLVASRDTSRIFKNLKRFQKDPFPHTLVFLESHATDVRGNAELFIDYFVSVVIDVNYEIFEPTASQLTGHIKVELSKEMLEREL